ncbi:hypothetical protein KBC75_02125, partial [Candidatus Shapirobacteria bacterium]|nr:hypothetical protein [Candidatus Shapirobacteria bacterium]
MKNIRNIAISLALLSLVSLVSYRFGEYHALGSFGGNTSSPLNLNLMWKVREKLMQTYLDKSAIKDDKMVYGAITGMVASLDDPYTMYLPPTDNKATNEDLAGQFGGVGIQLGYKDKNLAVMAPLAKTPAEKAGVLAGDLILKIIDKDNK